MEEFNAAVKLCEQSEELDEPSVLLGEAYQHIIIDHILLCLDENRYSVLSRFVSTGTIGLCKQKHGNIL